MSVSVTALAGPVPQATSDSVITQKHLLRCCAAEVVREVGLLVYDEVHYLRDAERGVVWEESIILAPKGCRMAFLSATIPNTTEFASWVAATHGSPVHVVYTEYRPTPLQHYMFPAGKGLCVDFSDRASCGCCYCRTVLHSCHCIMLLQVRQHCSALALTELDGPSLTLLDAYSAVTCWWQVLMVCSWLWMSVVSSVTTTSRQQ